MTGPSTSSSPTGVLQADSLRRGLLAPVDHDDGKRTGADVEPRASRAPALDFYSPLACWERRFADVDAATFRAMPTWANSRGAMPLYRLRISNEEQGYTNHHPAVELLAGDVASADGTPRRLRQLIDRRGDRYIKQLSDPGTERVLMYVDEPLSRHQGYGSAKPELREGKQRYRRRGARRS
jgi:hypothetical protein